MEATESKVYAGLLNGEILFADYKNSLMFDVDELSHLGCNSAVTSIAASSNTDTIFASSGSSSNVYRHKSSKTECYIPGSPVYKA